MRRFLAMALTPALGFGLLVGGLAYNVLCAGIPYQDAAPAVQARWELHGSIATVLILLGLGLFLLGILASPVVWVLTKNRYARSGRAAE